jgi:hypothetical protein
VSRRKRPRRRATTRQPFDLGILVVHGIGSQARGDTLRGFAEPLGAFIADRLATSTDVIGAFRITRDERPQAGRHRMEFEFGGLDAAGALPIRQRWLAAECYWDDVAQADDLSSLWTWLLRVVPWLLMWQLRASVTAGLVARLGRRRAWLNPLTWYVFFCNFFWSLVLRSILSLVFLTTAVIVAIPMTFMDVSDSSELPRLLRAVIRGLLATLGDAEAFVTRPNVAAAMQARFHDEYAWMCRQTDAVVIVAHSQGAALTYRALRDLDRAALSPLNGVFCMGSGLGPLGSIAAPSRSFGLSVFTLIAAVPGFVTLPSALIPVAVTASLLILSLWLLLVTLGVFILAVILDPGTVSHEVAHLLSALASRVAGDVATNGRLVTIGILLALPSLAATLFVGGARRRDLAPPVERNRWIEYYSPLDPVSLGTRRSKHATVVRVVNWPRGRLFDEHTSYFINDRNVLPDLCQRLGSWLSIRLPTGSDAAPEPHWRRMKTWLVLGAPSVLTMIAFLFGRAVRIW